MRREPNCHHSKIRGDPREVIVLVSDMSQLSGPVADSLRRIIGKLKPILDSQTETKDTLENFTTDLEDKLSDLWTAINEREDLLEDLVRERQNENTKLAEMLQYDLQVKENELLEQSQHLQEMEETLEYRENMIDKLRGEIAELEQDQANSMEQSDHLEQIREKHKKLEEEAAAKAALVVELRTKIRESQSAIAYQTQEHKKKIDSLRKLMEEQIAKAQTAQARAVEKAQGEALQDVNNIKAEFEGRLSHAIEQGVTLQNALDTARADLLALEKNSNCDAQKMALLETELEKAKSKDAGAMEDAKKKDEARRVMLEEQGEHIRKLESELVVWEQKFDKLMSNARAYDKSAFVVLGSLKQWVQQHTAIQELASEMAQCQSEGQQKVDSQFASLVEVEILQRAMMKYCQDQEKAIDAFAGFRQSPSDYAGSLADTTAELSLAAGLVGSKHPAGGSATLAEGLLDRARRVMLRSPAEVAPHPRPPSVNTEQERRRTAERPRSIMKAVSYDISSGILPSTTEQQSSQENDEIQQRSNSRPRPMGRDVLSEESRNQSRGALRGSLLQGGTMLNHGPYNRAVARSNSRPVDATGRGASQKPTSALEGPYEGGDNRTLAADSRKRQEAPGQEHDPSSKRTKRTKISTTAIQTPCPSPSEGSVEDAPTAPRKRNQKIVDVRSRSPIRACQLSQAAHRSHQAASVFRNAQSNASRPSRASSNTDCGDLSQNNSQDPLSLYYQRRQAGAGGEDSQESMTFSQDALGSSETSLSMARRFSGMP